MTSLASGRPGTPGGLWTAKSREEGLEVSSRGAGPGEAAQRLSWELGSGVLGEPEDDEGGGTWPAVSHWSLQGR